MNGQDHSFLGPALRSGAVDLLLRNGIICSLVVKKEPCCLPRVNR